MILSGIALASHARTRNRAKRGASGGKKEFFKVFFFLFLPYRLKVKICLARARICAKCARVRTRRKNVGGEGEGPERRVSLTEKALRKTRHCMMPSIVSPVKQKVPVRCRPLRPITEQRLACTKAFCDRVAAARVGWREPALIRRSSESMSLR